MNRPPLLLSGPSGVGKSYLAYYLSSNYEASRIVPTTTRPIRINEQDGVDYYFLRDEEYDFRRQSGEMFMSNEFFGAKYGFERRAVESILAQGRVPITEIFTPKLEQFKAAYPDSRAIFLMPENTDLVVNRMRRRGDPEDKIEYRVQEGLGEIEHYRTMSSRLYEKCYIVGENNFDIIAQSVVENYILGEGSRLHK